MHEAGTMTAALRSAAPVAPAAIERLKAVVGRAGYLDDPADIAPYCRGWRDGWDGRVPIVLRPQSTQETAAIVRICAELRVAIIPQGGNTGLTGAAQPHADMSEVILTTSRMNRIRAVDVVNDSIIVEAGVVLKDIQAATAHLNRLFPLSLGAEGSCQIGGNISTNAGGVHVLRYGTTRNLVLGLEVVLPDGSIWNGLRALRKDNTGYDMKQLFIGAEGTLGVITAAVLRLFPRPSASETAWIGLPSAAAAVDLLGHMRARLGDAISAFELICRGVIDILLHGAAGHEDPMQGVHPWYVLMDVTSQGPPGSLQEPLSEALASAHAAGLIGDAVIAASGAQAAKRGADNSDTVRWLRGGRACGGRAEGTDARNGGAERHTAAGGAPALPDGRRDAGGPGRRGRYGLRPVRLRVAHAQCAQRHCVHQRRPPVDQAGGVCPRPPAARRRLRMPHVSAAQPRLPSPSVYFGRDSGGARANGT